MQNNGQRSIAFVILLVGTILLVLAAPAIYFTFLLILLFSFDAPGSSLNLGALIIRFVLFLLPIAPFIGVVRGWMLYKKERYKEVLPAFFLSTFGPLILIFLFSIFYRLMHPKPSRPSSAAFPSGFLVPASNSIPEGFRETMRQNYGSSYFIDYLHIKTASKSDTTRHLSISEYANDTRGLCRDKRVGEEFEYKGVKGKIVSAPDPNWNGVVINYNLYWNDEGKCLIIRDGPFHKDGSQPDDLKHILETLVRSK